MIIKAMTEKDAKNISVWEYDSQYSIYNIGGWNTAKVNNWAITDKVKRKSQFRSVFNEKKQLIGYFRFKKSDNNIKLGLGLHPSLCGLGLGEKFLQNILNSKELKNNTIEIEVREFNKRALKCYKKVGFKIIGKKNHFIIMNLTN